MHDPQNAAAISTFALIGILAGLIVAILFCLSLYSAMKHVPQEKRAFPAWLCWMLLIPLAGYVFAWIMLPFGIPNSFKAALPQDKAAQNKAGGLFGVGLTLVILMTCAIIPYVNFLTAIPSLILFIIYWAKISSFKNRFLKK